MEGLEKITERILQDAKTECDEKISTAKEDVNQIKSKYRTEAEKMLCVSTYFSSGEKKAS